MTQKSKVNSNHETLALVLLAAGLVEFFLFLWQIIYLPKNLLGYLNLAFSLFDFYLAFAFFKNKPGIRKTFFLRLFLGLICWLSIRYLTGIQYGFIWAKIGILLSLAWLGLNRVKKPVILAVFTLILISINACSTGYYITYKQPLLVNLKKYGKNSYTIQKYNFTIDVPSHWKIVPRKNFARVKEKFLKTEAEIALFTQDGNSFCLIIPNENNGFKENYSLGQIKKRLAANLKTKKTVKINNMSFFPDKNTGFGIQYTDIIQGTRQDYLIIYIKKDKLTLKFIGWTLENNQEKIYREIKNIVKNTLINKK
ncbi:MAG: hypothetical protein K9L77_01790 [Candidatus Omnitrophica bacterium]|nr:hypothetical protein [Candidatus Omnitrophota bacterium]